MMEDNNIKHVVNMKHLPPGFRFDPSDEELVIHFLHSKVSSSSPNNLCLIPELEGFYHPSQLHGEALESCGEWYFYTKKTENRNRINENGYWKELMDMDQPIFARNSNKLVGWKKCFVFYNKGTFPLSGVKTGWFMQEYHACSPNFGRRTSKRPDANKWVLCRVQQICDDESHWMNTSSYEEKYDSEVELSSSDELYYLAMDDDQDDIISCPH